MVELTTYLFPAVQALFCLVIAVVWLAGFIRQRNFGFLLLTLATLAEGITSLIRQMLINYVFLSSTSSFGRRTVYHGRNDRNDYSGDLHCVLDCYRSGRESGRLPPTKVSNPCRHKPSRIWLGTLVIRPPSPDLSAQTGAFPYR
jgi:hypothetical protein